jgi:Zn-dependent peptidase ImmA (M78 family)
MPSEGIPVNKDVIIWARQRAGLSPDEAAQKFAKIAAWEAGTALPSYPQLEQMADAFRIPVAVFFFPQPPIVPPIRETFRTLPDAEFTELPRRIQQLLRKAKAFQIGLYELTQGRNPAERLITREVEFGARMSVDTMAARVRSYLGVSLEQQTAWRNAEQALKEWRQALYRVGIFVFKDAFREESFSGFSLYDDVFPIIYVNNSQTETRQIFTLFHELAHLLSHTSGIDPLDDEYVERLPARAEHIEVLCNRFAAQFLLPEEVFESAFAGRPATERTAEILADRFHVSREFIFRRFLDRRLISQGDYRRAAQRWAAQKQAGGGGNSYWSKIEDGPIESLLQWAKHNRKLFETPTAEEGAFVAKIYAVRRFQQNIEQKKLLRGGKVADPFVIAKAACENRTVVTIEVKKHNAVKIPNICEHFGVNCLSLPEFMEAEGWTF